MTNKKVCIIGDLYKTYSSGNQGGGEAQLLMLAKTLVRIGFEVCIVDFRIEKKIISGEGFIFIPVTGKNTLTIIDKFTKKAIRLFKTLSQINCDYYFSSIMGFQQFIPLIVSKKKRVKFYYWVAADLELEGFRKRWHYWYRYNLNAHKLYSIILSEIFFPLVLRFADTVFAQHLKQLKMLNQKNSDLLNNVVDEKAVDVVKSDYYVWVGSIDRIKGFQFLERAVADIQNLKMIIIGRIRDESCRSILDQICKDSNVQYLGYLEKNDQVLSVIAGAKALISTAEKEGFPITFIEAWSLNTPVISLFVDPGNIINKNHLGFCANGDYNSFTNYIENNSLNNSSTSTYQFFKENYSAEKFERTLKKIFVN